MKAVRDAFGRRRIKKCVSVFLLIFQGIFLNIVVPGHTRGVITVSGGSSVASLIDLGCPFCSQSCKIDTKKAPNDKDRSECAICQIAARLTLPLAIDFVPPLLCDAEAIVSPAPPLEPLIPIQFVRQDRAPPHFA